MQETEGVGRKERRHKEESAPDRGVEIEWNTENLSKCGERCLQRGEIGIIDKGFDREEKGADMGCGLITREVKGRARAREYDR